jgi:hypothetical protein
MSRRRRHTYKELIDGIREHKRNSCICDTTFTSVPVNKQEEVEAQLQYKFDLWWDSWIEPKLAELEARLCRGKWLDNTQAAPYPPPHSEQEPVQGGHAQGGRGHTHTHEQGGPDGPHGQQGAPGSQPTMEGTD